MATSSALRQRVLNNLYATGRNERPHYVRLNGALTDSTESVVLDDGTQVNQYDIVEFVSGEQAYVLSVATNTLTVIRGWNGTTAAAQADNSFASVNPTWTIAMVDDALVEIMHDLSAQGLYILAAGTPITLVSGQDSYEIVETDVFPQRGVVSIYYQETSDSIIQGLEFRNVYEPGASIFTTSGFGVVLFNWGNNAAGDDLEVMYAKQVTALADSDDEPLLEQLLVMGATARALSAREGPRIHDPGRFTDRTVQPGQPLRDAGFFAGQYQRLVWRYRGHLKAREGSLPGRSRPNRYRR